MYIIKVAALSAACRFFRGYNSDPSDAEAEYLKQRRAQHESAGPALSDPCKSTRKMIRAEKKKWAL